MIFRTAAGTRPWERQQCQRHRVGQCRSWRRQAPRLTTVTYI